MAVSSPSPFPSRRMVDRERVWPDSIVAMPKRPKRKDQVQRLTPHLERRMVDSEERGRPQQQESEGVLATGWPRRAGDRRTRPLPPCVVAPPPPPSPCPEKPCPTPLVRNLLVDGGVWVVLPAFVTHPSVGAPLLAGFFIFLFFLIFKKFIVF